MSIDKTVNNLIIRDGGSVVWCPSGGDETSDNAITIQVSGTSLKVYSRQSGAQVEIWEYSV